MKLTTALATLAICAAAALLAAPLRASSLAQGEIPPALRASFVQVELTAQPYQGEGAPYTLAPDLRGERPRATAGYLVAPDLVIAPDFNISPRFVRSWSVRWQGATTPTGNTAATFTANRAAAATTTDTITTTDTDSTDTSSTTPPTERPAVKRGKGTPGGAAAVRARRAAANPSDTASDTTNNDTSNDITNARPAAKRGKGAPVNATAARARAASPFSTATPIAWAADRNAMLLKLPRPFPSSIARPLEFAPAENTALTSCFSVKYYADLRRRTAIEPLAQARWYAAPDGSPALTVPPNSIIATDDGTPAAFAPSNTIPGDDSWKTPWRDWPWIYEEDRDARFEKLTSTAANALIFADLKLRPLPVRAGENPLAMMPSMRSNAAADPSARPQPAIIIAPNRVLVLANLAPSDTARLENVTLRLADGSTVNARFIASVAAYAAFVVEPDHDLSAPITLPQTAPDWGALRDHLLLTIDLRLQGETRIARPGLTRSNSVGYVSNDLADADTADPSPNLAIPILADPSPTLFVFDLDGNLLGIPLQSRPTNTAAGPVINTTTNGNTTTITATYNGNPVQITRAQIIPASALAAYAATGAPGSWADATNIPLTDAEERQLVWLGVDLQPLTRELAQAQGVADQTRNGSTGALVTKVYPDSPAARAGLQPGDVLLRMRRADTRQDIPITAGNANLGAIIQILSRTDQQIPDSMYDRIPPPWPVANSPLNQKLKELGAGKPLELDYARDGNFSTVKFTPEKGPAYYGTAPEATFESAGLNVRALTFETRGFYNIPADKSALIVSRVIAGSRASVAGLRPYDLILEVNDKPVTTPAAFAEQAKAGAKLRLLTRRMSQTRIVTLEIAK